MQLCVAWSHAHAFVDRAMTSLLLHQMVVKPENITRPGMKSSSMSSKKERCSCLYQQSGTCRWSTHVSQNPANSKPPLAFLSGTWMHPQIAFQVMRCAVKKGKRWALSASAWFEWWLLFGSKHNKHVCGSTSTQNIKVRWGATFDACELHIMKAVPRNLLARYSSMHFDLMFWLTKLVLYDQMSVHSTNLEHIFWCVDLVDKDDAADITCERFNLYAMYIISLVACF